MSNKKQLIIKAISEMNVSLLEVLLNDNKTYQGATKETFIEKINEVFVCFKNSKDTMLLPFSGFCNSKNSDNKIFTVLSFVGNVSNIALDLIFDEVENDFKDVYSCSNIKINYKNIKPILNFRIDIMLDEKVNFHPKPEKLEILQECQKAYNEINSKKPVLTKEKLIKWIENYTWLDETLNNNIDFAPFLYKSVKNFLDLYEVLKKAAKYIPFEITAFNAMAEFQKVNISSETELLNWLTTFESLRNDLVRLYEVFVSDGVLRINYSKKIKFEFQDFKNMIQLNDIFDQYYWKKLSAKYDEAVSELISTESTFHPREYYTIWLANNKTLYTSIQEEKSKSTNEKRRFMSVYWVLAWLYSYFDYEQEALSASKEFDSLNKEKENDVLNWLVQYEKTGMILFEMGCEFFDTHAIIKNDYLQLLENEDIYLALKDFEVLNKFQETHNSLYFEMLKKYTTEEKIVYEFLNPDDEFEEPELTEEERNNRSSLKYHLLKRGIIH